MLIVTLVWHPKQILETKEEKSGPSGARMKIKK